VPDELVNVVPLVLMTNEFRTAARVEAVEFQQIDHAQLSHASFAPPAVRRTLSLPGR
jgi:hypothetical protein